MCAIAVVLFFVAGTLPTGAQTETPVDALPDETLAPSSALSLQWLATAEPGPYTFELPGMDEPVTVFAKAPPEYADGDGHHVLMPCTDEMWQRFDAALCDLGLEVLDHPDTFLSGTHWPVIVDVPDALPLDEATATLAALPEARGVRVLPLVDHVWLELPMAGLDALVRPPVADVVEHVWLDRVVEASLDMSVPLVRADDAWNVTDGQGRPVQGTNVSVAILDTGIDYQHSDFGGCTASQFDAGSCRTTKWAVFTGESCPRPCDGNGHGTHVAATAAGDGHLTGVAPGAEIWAGKVLGNSGSGTWSGVIGGIDWAAQEGADIISMSLGGACTECDGSDPVSQAVDAATAMGSLVVVAAGNSGQSYASIGIPAVAKTALTVGATDDADDLASFSSRGPTEDLRNKPEVTAPGRDICAAAASAGKYSSNCGPAHASLSGTSMATPHVAGAAALLLQMHPGLDAGAAKSALVLAAEDVGIRVRDAGAGRLDAYRAVTSTLHADRAVADLGDLGSDATSSQDVTLYNHGASAVTVSVSPGQASDGEGGTHAVLTASPSSLSIPAGGNASVTLELDLTGLGGSFEGIVDLVAGGQTFRLPYTAARLSTIDVEILAGGVPYYHYAFLLDEAFGSVASSGYTNAPAFRVPPGSYHVVGMNSPLSSRPFVVREPVTATLGAQVNVSVDTDVVPVHSFQALDPDGNAIQSDRDVNAVRVVDGNGDDTFGFTYQATGFRQGAGDVRIHGLDLSSTGHEGWFAKDHSGAYAPECTVGYYARSTADRQRCIGAFAAAPAYMLVGTDLQDPDGSDTDHTWNATVDGVGPYMRSYDVRHDGAFHPHVSALIAPHSFFAFNFLSDGHAGREQELYYLDDTDWGITNSAWAPSAITERATTFRFDPADADDLPFYATPVDVGTLETAGTRLASSRHAFFNGVQESYYAKNGLLRLADQNNAPRPHVTIYKDDALDRSSYLDWDENVDRLFYDPQSGHDYRAVLSIPDIGWGQVVQTHDFEKGEATPSIGDVAYEPRFRSGQPFEVSGTAAAGHAVTVEFEQNGIWSSATIVRNGSAFSASYVPVGSDGIGVRVKATDPATDATRTDTYVEAAVRAIDLEFRTTHTNGLLSGTCTKGYQSCPDVVVDVLCDDAFVRKGYFRDGGMDRLEVDCSGDVSVAFAGSGPYVHQPQRPDITITRPKDYHVYVRDSEHLIGVPPDLLPAVPPLPVPLDPAFDPDPIDITLDDDPWVLGRLTIEFEIAGPVDSVDLYIQGKHKASLTPSATGRYSWVWSEWDQVANHQIGPADIWVEATNAGVIGAGIQQIWLLSAATPLPAVPHFDGAGAWQLLVSNPDPIFDPSKPLFPVEPQPVPDFSVPTGPLALSTREDKGTMVWMDQHLLLGSSGMQDVAWSYAPVEDWSVLAYDVQLGMEALTGERFSMQGVWTPALTTFQCTAGFPATCHHYAVGPMTLVGGGPGSTVAELEGIHGAILCTRGSSVTQVPHPCEGDELPTETLIRRLMALIDD